MPTLSIGDNQEYPDYDSAAASLPAVFTEQARLQFHNDSEFLTTSGINVTGFTTTPAFNLVLECADGQSFTDSAANALRYNQANGVGFRKTNSYGSVLTVSVPHTELNGLQISTTGTSNTIGLTESTNTKVDSCIIESSSNVRVVSSTGTSASYVNTVIVADEGSSATTRGVRASYTTPSFDNCTFICTFPNNTSFGIEKSGGAANSIIARNNAFFGFGIPMESGGWGVGTDYNATDASTLPAGTNNVLNLVASDQFENIASDATLDLRLKAGNSLDGAGTTTAITTDIYGQPRSLTAPSIGAFETQTSGTPLTVEPASTSTLGLSANPQITFASILYVSPTSTQTKSLSVDPVIAFNDVLRVTPQTAISECLSLNPFISFSSVLEVSPGHCISSSISVDPVITYLSALSVSPNSANSASLAVNPVVEYKGELTVSPVTLLTHSISINPFVSYGEGQLVGEVTARFGNDIITANYANPLITAKFKE